MFNMKPLNYETNITVFSYHFYRITVKKNKFVYEEKEKGE